MTDYQYKEGDRVRLDIPDETDLDYSRFHGRHGEVVAILEDDSGAITGDDRDAVLYCVRLNDVPDGGSGPRGARGGRRCHTRLRYPFKLTRNRHG